jgi:CheY-like chemotaxis protein
MTPHTPTRLLIVDDETSFVRALARLLQREGYTVDTASNGALALLQLRRQRYDVVVCDLRMPTLDGPAFYACLCQEHAYLRQRVLFLTGDSLRAESATFLGQCGERWLYKPCPATAVREALQQMLQAVQPSHARSAGA